MTEISDGTDTLHPILWMDYASARDARTRTHPLMGGGTAVTLAPAGPRKVVLALLFADEDESKACEDMHARPGVITITEDGRDTHSMQYVVTGAVTRELDPETAEVWIVAAEVQEVGAP
jgi:hypothetical protein